MILAQHRLAGTGGGCRVSADGVLANTGSNLRQSDNFRAPY